jgi:hypothetical protein
VKILFLLASPEYFRYYDDTLRLLADRGHRVSIAVNRQREGKARLDQLGWEHADVEFVGEAPRRADRWAGVAHALRGITDFSRYLDRRFADAPALRERIRRKSLPAAFAWLDAVRSLPAPLHRVWMSILAACETAIPPSAEVDAFVGAQQPDLVLVSPLVDFGAEQVDTIKSARRLGIPVAACIASWDNLTNKGLMRGAPDRVFVWNDAQRQEAVELHGVPRERVVTTGAQPFDRWFERTPATARDRFCATLGFDPARPIVLYTCSSSFIASAASELRFVRSWLSSLRAHPTLRDVNVLVRPHPFNVWDWTNADLSDLGPAAICPRQSYNPLSDESRAEFYDALFHCAAAVGINTSAMIEAAIVARPVLSIRAPEFAHTQDGTLHFRHLLPENGGFVQVAGSIEDHVEQLTGALVRPEEWQARTTAFVRTFIRPHGLDVPSAPRLVDGIEAAGALPPTRGHVPFAAPLFRGAMLLIGVLAYPIEELASEKPFGTLKRWARMKLHRHSKDLLRTARTLKVGHRLRRLAKRWT